MRKLTCVVLCLMCLGCGRGGSDLITFKPSDDGPDEFAVLPTKPLQTPPDLSALPTPTPGGQNITDPQPGAEAVTALGGRPGAARAGDGAILAHTTRFGVTPDIRRALAEEDARFRSANQGRLLERLFNVTVYYKVYGPLALDPYAELERFRAAGVRTPSVPPRTAE